ncbi:hypothetical protein PMZ80_006198 [Knufia obscura]|uniref:Uncharacterized protein n=2 Tax=Knufia TaxID=430999 RepID=A0AAN8EWD7_9EURO|nr:hypothetical protein PMZ80_006198 [Knufia obscura]KAK5953653.1 hypothetical protein OHC33_005597 [Knufia fluminis]
MNTSNRPAPILRSRDAPDPADLYPAHNISVPIDHFHNESRYAPHSDGMFNLRYHFDASHYRKGGPVIVLNGGESSIEGRLPYLQKGIVAQLAEATGGIGVILEHRYYGTSFPTPNLTTENFRFLTTEQALADQAYFAQHIVFPGMEDMNLTAPGTPYIAYGGSYAGAFVAFLRIQYPELTWGAISSSGVTEAIYDFWEYYEAHRKYAPADCVDTQGKLINIMDNILRSGDNGTIDALKSAFNSSGFTYNDDFANTIGSSFGYWQNRNWNPEVDDPTFFEYCGNITSDQDLFNSSSELASQVPGLIKAGGWGNESNDLTTAMLNWIGWSIPAYTASCDSTLDQCYGNHNASAPKYSDKSTDNYNSLSWAYQYCTEWGFLQSGSTVPENMLSLISRLVTIPYNMLICNYAFNITGPPDVDRINKFGGFNISYSRLAIIGGEADPWRAASPLATLDVPDRLNDTSTVSEPIILIEGAVHHWDENGIFANETTPELPPAPVRNAQAQLAQSVQAWMAEWQQHCINEPDSCNN